MKVLYLLVIGSVSVATITFCLMRKPTKQPDNPPYASTPSIVKDSANSINVNSENISNSGGGNVNIGNGNIISNLSNCTKLKPVSDFVKTKSHTKLKIAGTLNIHVKHSDRGNYVVWRGLTENGKQLNVSDSNVLSISSPNGCSSDFEVEVGTTGVLDDLTVSGASTLIVGENTSSNDLHLRAEGVSKVEINQRMAKLQIVAEGTSTINVGEVSEAIVKVDGVSKVTFRDVNSVNGKISGASTLIVSPGTDHSKVISEGVSKVEFSQ